jgi:uncharacterized iron-regulated membrane protein
MSGSAKRSSRFILWTGIGVGLYILMISLTGGVLVYRNELYRAATPPPILAIRSFIGLPTCIVVAWGGGISWCGRGLCDSTTKAIWAVFGLAPAIMFVTGAIIWWNRVLRPSRRGGERPRRDHQGTVPAQ